MNISNLTDIPKLATEKDQLGIEEYKNGLLDFIRNAQTPLTIALQGEWGSGKTSLLNSIRYELCNDGYSPYYGVWINTWEYGLMMDESTTLTNIISGVIAEVMQVISEEDVSGAQQLKKKAMSFLSKVSKVAVKTSANIATGGSVGDSIDELFDGSNGGTSVRDLRKELQNTINNFLAKHPEKKGFLFFIDDLDRINPPVAVRILELLKNIFDLEHCIFILAIDYDVVVKGLEPKFGKKTMENEREFRSFFEKIIQLPFSMPVSNYDVGDFLMDSLIKLNYFNGDITEDQKDIIQEISLLTVGKNPRAIKRLMNAISLMKCINRNKSDEVENNDVSEVINYLLFSLQISYPLIYKVISDYPNFTTWNRELVVTYGLNEMSEEFQKIINMDNELFDEEWERILFLICQKDFYLKSRSAGISRLLNRAKVFIEQHNVEIEDAMIAGLEISSVTSVDNNPTLHVARKANLKDSGINPENIDPIFSVVKHTNTLLGVVSKKMKEKMADVPLILWIGKKTNEDKCFAALHVNEFKNKEDRVRFMNHLEGYGYNITEKMKSPEARFSTIYSERIKLKNPNDEREIHQTIEAILKNSVPVLEKIEQAFLSFEM